MKSHTACAAHDRSAGIELVDELCSMQQSSMRQIACTRSCARPAHELVQLVEGAGISRLAAKSCALRTAWPGSCTSSTPPQCFAAHHCFRSVLVRLLIPTDRTLLLITAATGEMRNSHCRLRPRKRWLDPGRSASVQRTSRRTACPRRKRTI